MKFVVTATPERHFLTPNRVFIALVGESPGAIGMVLTCYEVSIKDVGLIENAKQDPTKQAYMYAILNLACAGHMLILSDF
jgi:hypothetical protein